MEDALDKMIESERAKVVQNAESVINLAEDIVREVAGSEYPALPGSNTNFSALEHHCGRLAALLFLRRELGRIEQ